MKNNQFKEFSTVEEMVATLNIQLFTANKILGDALKYCKDKRVSHYTMGTVSGFRMITLVIKGKTAKNTLKQGYQLVYAYNLDYNDLSELGECYIVKKDDGEFYRAS